MSFPRYESYKDSGVEWLSEVPEHWVVAALKRRFQVIGGSTPKSDQETFWGGEIIWVTPADLSKLSSLYISDSQRKISSEGLASCGTTLVPKNSVILSTRAPIGSLAIAETDLCTNQGCKSLVPFGTTDAKFFGYLLSISAVELNIRGKGTTFLELSGDELSAFKVPVPLASEQQTIATFLDRETAQIDALIAEQQRLVELLKEKRQAIISHAVTKGLSPGAPMKDSGIEWLGEVPEHWVQTPIKHVLNGIIDTEHKTAPFFEDGEYLVVRTTNIKNGKLILDGAKYTDLESYIEWTKRGVPEPGDILFTREAPAGEACLVPNGMKLCVGQRTVTMRVNRAALDSGFGLWSLYGGVSAKFITDLSQGSTVTHFNMSDIGNIPIMLPLIKEQSAIAAFLDRETAKFDILTAERRTALISAAVTGKIDVRTFTTLVP